MRGTMASRIVTLPDREIDDLYRRFVDDLERKIDDPGVDNDDLCRDTLMAVYHGPQAGHAAMMRDPAVPLSVKASLACLDPRNVTLESEYYAEVDPVRFYRNKPLLWLWIMFDRSPMGHNDHLGLLLRRMLAGKVFRKCGQNVKFFRNVEFSFGYNITCGSNTVFHREVFVDDRGEVIIGDDVSLSDYANIYSHAHDILDINDVSLGTTVIGDGARVTYHAVVLSGMKVGKDAMVGSMGVVTRDVPDHAINVGIPAKTVKIKDRGQNRGR
ncbi:MAG TPA: acyltransferase [Candidatus Polarisedimenticolia bacterium]|nr:acyltransferase [Candidatus Polarisedimenticolia bacterium]